MLGRLDAYRHLACTLRHRHTCRWASNLHGGHTGLQVDTCRQAGEGEDKSSKFSFQGHVHTESHKIDIMPETVIQQYITADFGDP